MKTSLTVFISILFLTLSLVVWSAEDNETGWTLHKEKEGIQVYTRPVPGYEIIEVQGVTRLNTTVDRIVAVYADAAQCRDWVPSCARSEIIEQISPAEFTLYRRIANTFPFKDRDYALNVKVVAGSNGEVFIRYEDAKDGVPENRCCVRMDRLTGFWQLVPQVDGSVEVTYRAHLLPGGGFPSALVNAGIPDLPFDTLTSLKKYLGV